MVDVCRYIHIEGEVDHVNPSERSMQMLELDPQSDHASTVRNLRSFVLEGKKHTFLTYNEHTMHTSLALRMDKRCVEVTQFSMLKQTKESEFQRPHIDDAHPHIGMGWISSFLSLGTYINTLTFHISI